jgi:predicted nucleic acid-binding protein
MTTLVLDANVALTAAAHTKGFRILRSTDLVAPPLLWPEARSALHVALWRELISVELARDSLDALESGAVKERRPRRLGHEAWAIADQMGWSKTYDAEYLATARLLGARLATFDRRMLAAAARLGIPTASVDAIG